MELTQLQLVLVNQLLREHDLSREFSPSNPTKQLLDRLLSNNFRVYVQQIEASQLASTFTLAKTEAKKDRPEQDSTFPRKASLKVYWRSW